MRLSFRSCAKKCVPSLIVHVGVSITMRKDPQMIPYSVEDSVSAFMFLGFVWYFVICVGYKYDSVSFVYILSLLSQHKNAYNDATTEASQMSPASLGIEDVRIILSKLWPVLSYICLQWFLYSI